MSVARCFQAAFRKPAQRPAILKAQTPHARHSTGICKAVAADISGVNSSEFVSSEPLASGDASLSGTATQHKTKVICTIGPSTSSPDVLLKLAKNGMDVARLNMTHSDLPWHKAVIDQIKTLNQQGFNIAIMVDTEGSEVHLKAQDPTRVETGDKVVFSVRPNGDTGANHFQVSYEGFVDDVRVGDFLFVDGGMAIVRVISIDGPDVTGQVMEPGRVMSRATVTLRRGKELVRGNNSTLPVVTAKDWQDIDFAIDNKVDFVAISFVRDANIISNVRAYINSRLEERHPGHVIDVVAKIEAYDSISALPSIVDAADAIMVARSDLGAQIPMEDVPAVQKEVVFRCRQAGKPVIVASQLLSSMMDVPVPTRAEVADCADAVRQQADALMLSAETAAGQHPLKAVKVMRQVFSEVEDWVAREKSGAIKLSSLSTDPSAISSEEICTAAVNLASQLGAKAILVYTRTGSTAGFVSRRRPDCLVLAITDSETIFRRLTLRWGVTPMLLPLDSDPERNVQATFSAVRDHDVLKSGDLVVVVSDIVACDHTVRSVQIRHIV